MLWSLTNSEMRVVSTNGSCENKVERVTAASVKPEGFLLSDTYSEFLDEGDEFAPK